MEGLQSCATSVVLSALIMLCKALICLWHQGMDESMNREAMCAWSKMLTAAAM